MNSKIMAFGLALMLLATLAFADGQASNGQAVTAQDKVQDFGPMLTGKGVAIAVTTTSSDADLRYIKFAIGKYPGKILDSTNPGNVLTNTEITLLGVMKLGKDNTKYAMKNIVLNEGIMTADLFAKAVPMPKEGTGTDGDKSNNSAESRETLAGKISLEKTNSTTENDDDEAVKDKIRIWKGSLEISNQKYTVYILVEKKTVIKGLNEQKTPPYEVQNPKEVQEQKGTQTQPVQQQGQSQTVQEQTNPFNQMIQGVFYIIGIKPVQQAPNIQAGPTIAQQPAPEGKPTVSGQEKINESKKEEGCKLGSRNVPKGMKLKLGDGKILECNGGGVFVEINASASANGSASNSPPIPTAAEDSTESNGAATATNSASTTASSTNGSATAGTSGN